MTETPDSLAQYGLMIIDRGIRRYERHHKSLVDNMRSRAHMDLAIAIPVALKRDNPRGYVIIAVTNAFKQELRGHNREFRHIGSIYWEYAEDLLAIQPLTAAMFREEMANAPQSPPKGYHVQPKEWETFREICLERPHACNREIAIVMNRKTGRKFDVFSVSRARRRLAI